MNVQIFQYKQAGRLRTRSYFDSVISDNLPKDEFAKSIIYTCYAFENRITGVTAQVPSSS